MKEVLPEIKALVPEQWDEMAKGFDGMTYEPNWPVYLTAEERGMGLLLTARTQEMELIGYFGFLVHPHLSAQSEMAATSTPYYVKKRRDRGVVLRRLIKQSLEILKTRKVSVVSIRTHAWASCWPILKGLDFRPFETSYMLRLGEPNA